MWPTWNDKKNEIATALQDYSNTTAVLKGIEDENALDTLSWQLVASLRREKYYLEIQHKRISINRADPNSLSFDAERAVAYHIQQRNLDEAAWLIFLMTHFAKPENTGWLRLKDVYGKLGAGIWDWQSVTADPIAFSNWLTTNWRNIGGKFGNHRKYESLRPNAKRNTTKVVADYVRWIGEFGHQRFFADVVRRSGNNPHVMFDMLFQNLSVTSFGRLAKFDYLMLIARYGIAPISPGQAYLKGATGPTRGARLLCDGNTNSGTSIKNLQMTLDRLDENLTVGMSVIEDALCNWQKSPKHFVHFIG